MASSSKRRRASSSNESSADKTSVISVSRTDTLPRKVNASADRRKPVVQPTFDASTEPLATAIAGSKKRTRRQQQTETVATRTNTTRAGGRASGKRNKPAAMEVTRVAAALVTEAPAPVAEECPIGVAEAPAVIAPAVEKETAGEQSEMTALGPPAIGVLAAIETEVVVEASAIVEEAPIVEIPFALPVAAVTFPSSEITQVPISDGKRSLLKAVSRLLSALRGWIGVRR